MTRQSSMNGAGVVLRHGAVNFARNLARRQDQHG
jgi:hypothetical protein